MTARVNAETDAGSRGIVRDGRYFYFALF